MNELPEAIPAAKPVKKTLTLSARQRALFRALLHRDLRKCSASAMDSFRRVGWASDYDLTAKGRRSAEVSELSPQDRSLTLDMP